MAVFKMCILYLLAILSLNKCFEWLFHVKIKLALKICDAENKMQRGVLVKSKYYIR